MIRRPRAQQRAMPSAVELGVVLALDVHGGRPEDHVAEHRRGDQDSLGGFGRHRQQDVVDQLPAELVEDDQLAAPGRDGEAVVTGHSVDLVGVQPGGVDHPARCEATARGAHLPSTCARAGAARSPPLSGEGPPRRGRPGSRRRAAASTGRRCARRGSPWRRGPRGRDAARAGRARLGSTSRAPGRSRSVGRRPRSTEIAAAPRRSKRPAARRFARPGCRPPRRRRVAARGPAPRAAPRASPAWHRSRCAGWRCWPCWSRRRRRAPPRSGPGGGRTVRARGRSPSPTSPAPTMATS